MNRGKNKTNFHIAHTNNKTIEREKKRIEQEFMYNEKHEFV